MKLIALDLGSHMALAHNGDDEVTITDYRHFEGIRAHRVGRTLIWLDQRVGEILGFYPTVQAIIYERPFARGMDATRSLWGLAGIVEAIAFRHGLAVLDMTPADVKKFAANSSQAQKNLMLDAANRMGYKGNNEHEADAFCLLKAALSTAAVTPVTNGGHRKTQSA